MMVFIHYYTKLCLGLRKPTTLQKVDSGSALCKLDITDGENILSFNKINIGCGATKVINNNICTDTATPREISRCKEECVTFLSTVLGKIFKPLKYSLYRKKSSKPPNLQHIVLKVCVIH